MEKEIEQLKVRCGLVADAAERQGNLFQEQWSVLIRWCATTCLTLNAGGLVATLSAGEIDQLSQIWAGVWFLGGTIVSVMMAGVLAVTFNRIGISHHKHAVALRTFQASGDLELSRDLDTSEQNGPSTLGGFAIFCLLITLVVFTVGCGILIEGAQ